MLGIVLTSLLVFAAGFVTDFLWALYISETAAMREWTAATYGALIYVASATMIISYTGNMWFLIPGVLGGWLGTFIVVRRRRLSDGKE